MSQLVVVRWCRLGRDRSNGKKVVEREDLRDELKEALRLQRAGV